MPDVDPPNLGEVLRGLEALRQDVAALIAEMKADRAENARIYVRADVYTAERTAQQAIVADLHRDLGNLETSYKAELAQQKAGTDAKFTVIETDRKADVAWRRQVLLALGVLTVGTLTTVVTFVINLLR